MAEAIIIPSARFLIQIKLDKIYQVDAFHKNENNCKYESPQQKQCFL